MVRDLFYRSADHVVTYKNHVRSQTTQHRVPRDLALVVVSWPRREKCRSPCRLKADHKIRHLVNVVGTFK